MMVMMIIEMYINSGLNSNKDNDNNHLKTPKLIIVTFSNFIDKIIRLSIIQDKTL